MRKPAFGQALIDEHRNHDYGEQVIANSHETFPALVGDDLALEPVATGPFDHRGAKLRHVRLIPSVDVDAARKLVAMPAQNFSQLRKVSLEAFERMHRIQKTKTVPGFGADPILQSMCNVARMCICNRGLNQYLGPVSKSCLQVLSPLGETDLQAARICVLFVGWPAELLGDDGEVRRRAIESARCTQLLPVWRHIGHIYMKPLRPA